MKFLLQLCFLMAAVLEAGHSKAVMSHIQVPVTHWGPMGSGTGTCAPWEAAVGRPPSPVV